MKRVAVAVGFLSLVTGTLASCSADTQNTQADKNRGTELSSVAVTVRDLGNPFFVQIGKGAEAAAKRIGGGDVKTTLVSSGDDLNQQFNQIENFIASDVSMIVLNAADSRG
ncbi:MAG TPA: substrate-binding domain-containing protein, partial [Phormidium sp.]